MNLGAANGQAVQPEFLLKTFLQRECVFVMCVCVFLQDKIDYQVSISLNSVCGVLENTIQF